ncbi:EAL domain-containing protein, partial [Candidatus Gracilibacteria bacterium]|nr:EAL domain-containing protein [Candidatus Gracilibacteria bacterium]
VCAFMKENDGHFSVNLTEEDLVSLGFAERVHKKLLENGIDPSRMTVEVLEEIEDIESFNILNNMHKFRELGFESAIDDFGSGYANFDRMLSFAPNSLKIAMKYVRGINQNSTHQSLVRAIVGLAHDNDMAVVAEGVETHEEQEVLEGLGVDRSQGFLFSEPAAKIAEIIQK